VAAIVVIAEAAAAEADSAAMAVAAEIEAADKKRLAMTRGIRKCAPFFCNSPIASAEISGGIVLHLQVMDKIFIVDEFRSTRSPAIENPIKIYRTFHQYKDTKNQNKKPSDAKPRKAILKNPWRRPTFPSQTGLVSSTLEGLTAPFGIRG
jgi:hypothetical protein